MPLLRRGIGAGTRTGERRMAGPRCALCLPMRRIPRVGGMWAVVVGVMATPAWADWETVSSGALTIQARTADGSDVREYQVEGELAADVVDLQETLCDPERFPDFMPHVSEARVLSRNGKTFRVYTRIDPPVGGSRDYVTDVTVVQEVAADGTGTFRQTWRALPNAFPARSGITRIRINDGSWHVRPAGEGRSKVTYRFRVDPGGWVPEFVAELANKKTIPEQLQAIEREAQRRARDRSQRAQRPPVQQAPEGT